MNLPDLAEPPEPAARLVFGDRLTLARRYAELLATEGVLRGLIGPRETGRLWERHLLNCAVITELVEIGCSVLDVGSGAGLPGIVLAVARPDLSVVLIEPLARRTKFLAEVIAELGLAERVTVFRGRAEEYRGEPAEVVTARAVAPLDRLAAWCLPVTRVGGRMLALKGSSALSEVAEHGPAVRRLGGGDPTIRHCGLDIVDPTTTVVEVTRERLTSPSVGKGGVGAKDSANGKGRGRDSAWRRR